MSKTNNEILFKKFEIISCYKKDEHSAVYLANHIYLEKKVFLKVLNTETIPDSSVTERFKREAKILAQLEHPNIIKVFDFGMFKDFFYISFEHFESKNLRQLLALKQLTESEKKNIFIQLVKGLDFAHQKNVIHRDIKPENILVNDELIVKLTDFGLAQDSLDNFVTQRYSIVGTPAYMSPEQIQGEKLTLKSDLFSLGITAAEIFSGKNIFLGSDTNETINNILSFNEIENDEIFSQFDDEIKYVIKGLLAFNPEDRFDSCSEILKLFNEEIIEQTITKNEKKLKPWLIFIFLLAVVFIIWRFYKNLDESDKFVEKENNFQENVVEDSSSQIPSKTSIESDKLNEFPDQEKANISEIKSEEEKTRAISNEEKKSIQTTKTEKFGELYIKCYPWAKVYINNKYAETTPLSKNIIVKEGKYLVSLIHPDYPKYNDSILVTPNKLSFIEVNLDTLFGYFQCQVYPWSEIYINGNKKGVTPLENPIPLEEGVYNLRLVNPKYNSIETIIKIVKNDTLKMNFNLKDGSQN